MSSWDEPPYEAPPRHEAPTATPTTSRVRARIAVAVTAVGAFVGAIAGMAIARPHRDAKPSTTSTPTASVTEDEQAGEPGFEQPARPYSFGVQPAPPGAFGATESHGS
jgi:hypothetical protein